MEGHINCIILLPLEKLALRRILFILWNQIDILDECEVCDSISCDGNYGYSFRFALLASLVENKMPLVENKLSEFRLPNLLLEKVVSLIKPVGLEILHWAYFHRNFFQQPHTYYEDKYCFDCSAKKFDKRIFMKLSCTSAGAINYRNTAKELIRCEMLDNFLLFKLACLYCLEDYIPVLLNKLPKFIRDSLYDKHTLSQTAQAHLDAFWYRMLSKQVDITGRQFQISTYFYQSAFANAARMGNKAATEYFYQKLTKEERGLLFETAVEVALKDVFYLICSHSKFPEEKHSEVLCYLLSQMSPEQQMQLLQAHPYNVLKCFLLWPWQDLFMDVAELSWDFLPVHDYYQILESLSTIEGKSDYHCSVDLFQKLFLRSPSNFKSSFVDEESQHGNILFRYFCAKDVESIRIIFRNIDDSSKTRLAYSDQGFQICRRLIKESQWHLLNLYIQEAMLFKEDMVRLKENWKQRFSGYYQYECQHFIQEWERFFRLHDEIDKENNISLKDNKKLPM